MTAQIRIFSYLYDSAEANGPLQTLSVAVLQPPSFPIVTDIFSGKSEFTERFDKRVFDVSGNDISKATYLLNLWALFVNT